MTRRLSAQQRALVIGTILGDGCLIANRKNTSARLQVRHQQKHFEYVRWKYELLKPLVKTPPKIDVHNNSEFFRTIHHQDLGALRTIFYPSGKKIVPSFIAQELTHPMSLAVWFQDDGNGYSHYRGLRISSYSFLKKGNEKLQSALQNNFGLNPHIIQDTKGHQLLFTVAEAKKTPCDNPTIYFT